MSELYRDYEVEASPSWFRDDGGTAFAFCIGLVKDGIVEAAKNAVKSRFAELAPSDALTYSLRDFDLDQPWNETATKTRARLLSAWAQWRLAGTKAGVIAALNTAGFAIVTVQERVDPDRWWTFRVVLRPPFPWDHMTLGWARWGSGRIWGSGYRWQGSYPTADDRLRTIATITKWKPRHAVLTNVVAQLEGPYWGEFSWGDGTVFGGTEDTIL